jgi:K+-transporting ATPase KdpF subunit
MRFGTIAAHDLESGDGIRKGPLRRRQESVKAASRALNRAFHSPGRRNPAARKRPERHVRPAFHRADGGDLCATRLGPEVGRGTVSQNLIGLALAVLLALFLFAALLFPERF